MCRRVRLLGQDRQTHDPKNCYNAKEAADCSFHTSELAINRPNNLFLSGLCAMGVTGIWLGLKQRSLARASLSACFYLLLLPLSLMFWEPTSPARITVVLVIAYCAIAIVMHRKLGRLVRGGDSMLLLLRRSEW